MKDEELEKILREELSVDISIPEGLDRKVYQKMNKKSKAENRGLLLGLLVINSLMIIVFSACLWMFSANSFQKILIVFCCCSFLSLLFFFQFFVKQTNLNRGG